MARDAVTILYRADQVLGIARTGLEDLGGDDDARRIAGLFVVTVFGRSVTNIIQGLRSAVDVAEFEAWYAPYVAEMRRDKLLRFFYRMRSSLLKEGQPGVDYSFSSLTFENRPGKPKLITRGPFTGDFFFNEQEVGWVDEVEGEQRQIIFPIWDGLLVDRTLRFRRPPKRHLGKKLSEDSAPELARMYVSYLAEVVASAKNRFGAEPRLFEVPPPPAS